MIRAFLFDIGNVILKFDFSKAMRRIAARSRVSDPIEVTSLIDRVKVPYEAGEIPRSEFLRGAFDSIGYQADEAEFCAAWADIFELNEPMVPVIESLAPRFPLYLLSNTNDIHFDDFTQRYPVFRHFRGATLSHVVRASKPGRTIYEKACRAHGLTPETTYFIDDLKPNIDTAVALGFTAFHYHYPEHEALVDDLKLRRLL